MVSFLGCSVPVSYTTCDHKPAHVACSGCQRMRPVPVTRCLRHCQCNTARGSEVRAMMFSLRRMDTAMDICPAGANSGGAPATLTASDLACAPALRSYREDLCSLLMPVVRPGPSSFHSTGTSSSPLVVIDGGTEYLHYLLRTGTGNAKRATLQVCYTRAVCHGGFRERL